MFWHKKYLCNYQFWSNPPIISQDSYNIDHIYQCINKPLGTGWQTFRYRLQEIILGTTEFHLRKLQPRPTIKKSVCCHPTDPKQLPLPPPPRQKKILVFLKKCCCFSCSQTQFFKFFCISLQNCWECAVVNRAATERGMNWNKCHSLLYFIFKILPFNSVCKEIAYLPTHTQNSESDDSKQIIFYGWPKERPKKCLFTLRVIRPYLDFLVNPDFFLNIFRTFSENTRKILLWKD